MKDRDSLWLLLLLGAGYALTRKATPETAQQLQQISQPDPAYKTSAQLEDARSNQTSVISSPPTNPIAQVVSTLNDVKQGVSTAKQVSGIIQQILPAAAPEILAAALPAAAPLAAPAALAPLAPAAIVPAAPISAAATVGEVTGIGTLGTIGVVLAPFALIAWAVTAWGIFDPPGPSQQWITLSKDVPWINKKAGDRVPVPIELAKRFENGDPSAPGALDSWFYQQNLEIDNKNILLNATPAMKIVLAAKAGKPGERYN